MHKKILVLIVLGVMCLSTAFSADAKIYGEGLTGTEITPISQLLEEPERFEGETIRISGTVQAVCKKAGCWMEIQAAGTGIVQVKVPDGVIVFPVVAVNRKATAEGKVKILDMSREEYIGWLKHKAEENGVEFDPAAVGEAPYRIVRLECTGAVVE